MPPKKQQKANGFMVFTLEWKQKYGRGMPLHQATQEAGKIWTNMDASERAPYNDKAKQERMTQSRSMAEKLTCTGVPISQVDKERMDQENKERLMKRDIEMTVSKSARAGKIEHQSYYFIMVNYFTKTLKGGVYVPAEIAVCEFSLQAGVCRIYQTLINPGVTIYGHQYEAQHHSDATHNLPLPPNALGEKKMGNIYNDVLNFIRDTDSNYYPPVYTHRDGMHVVESVLDFLKSDVDSNNIDLKVYPIQYLFYIMKEATCDLGELEKPKNFYITDAFFERDFFEFQIGIACHFHEENDKCKYCTQSYVTRWGYTFADYMCADIAVPLVPGRHCPLNTNLNAIITPAPSTINDSKSLISLDKTSIISDDSKPFADSSVYYDSPKSSQANKLNSADFPALGGGSTKKKSSTTTSSQRLKATRNFPDTTGCYSDISFTQNLSAWSERSRNIPRQPLPTDFEVDDSKVEDSSTEYEDFSSVASYGRGRSSIGNSSFKTAASNSDAGGRRGRFF